MEKQSKPNKPFNEILLQSIDEILTAIGGSAKDTLYFYLKSERGINKEQIPDRIEEFAETLLSIFGVGASHIEQFLVKRLEAKTGVDYPFSIKASSLQDCVVFIRQQYESHR